MIFWITIGIILVLGIAFGIWVARDEDSVGAGIAAAVISSLLTAMVAAMILFGVGSAVGDFEYVSEDKYELRNVNSYEEGSGTDGLYRYKEDETPKAPYLVEKFYEKHNPFIWPWNPTVETSSQTIVWED